MGSSDVVQEVEDTLPGIRFTVESETRGKKMGRVVLVATIENEAMWETVIAKLDGLKLFNTLESEVLDALGMAVDLKQEALDAKEEELEKANKRVEDLTKTLAHYESVLEGVGMDLGLE